MNSKTFTYYAVFFGDDEWHCSLFFELPIFTQERTYEEALAATRSGIEDHKIWMKESDQPLESPLAKEEVEKRAREGEKEGCVGKGWRLVPIDVAF